MKTFSDKLKMLWYDDRSAKARVLTAVLVNTAFAFFLLFFTPSEMFIANMGDFGFSYGVTAAVMGVASAVYVALSTAVMSLLRGKIYDAAVTFVFSFTVASYIQGNFLNGDIGALNGQPVEWQEHAKAAMLNLLIWALIMLAPYVVRIFSRKIWNVMLRAVSAFLVGMLSITLAVLILNADFSQMHGNEGFISRKGLYEVGSENNVIVFVLDYFDNEYADDIEGENPGFFDGLEGFTRTPCRRYLIFSPRQSGTRRKAYGIIPNTRLSAQAFLKKRRLLIRI